jgi:type I restriction enzyme S subunit
MAERALRPGWKVWRFDQMAVNVADRVEPGDVDVDYYVGLEHLDSDSLTIRRWGEPSDVEATKLRFRQGDIIFGRRRVYQRKLAVAEFDGICSAHAMVLRPKTDVVLPEFLPFFMQSDLFMNRALEISVGSLSPTINWRTLARQEFALPPLAEQQRILEALLGIEESLESLADLESRIESLRKSYIVDTFSKMLIEHKAKVVSVADAGEVLMGRQRSPKYEQGISPRPYLRVANVFDGHIDTTDVKTMDFSDEEFEKYRLIRGDILLNEGQSRELVGRSSIFRDEVPGCCFQNTLLRFRPTSVSPEYAQHYFQFCLYTGRFAGVAKQTTSIAHLGAKRLALMEFPLVSEEVEQRIVQDLAHTEGSLQKASQRKVSIEQVKRLFLEIG